MAMVKSTRIAEVRLKARSSEKAGTITSAETAALRVRSTGSGGGGGGAVRAATRTAGNSAKAR